MNSPRVNLIVLRVSDIDRAADFYRRLGLEFSKHAHGSGPEHYASETDGFVFELYPATPEQPVSASTRVGFEVANVDEAVERVAAVAGVKVVGAPKDSEWGRRAVVADPDGHRVELVERRATSRGSDTSAEAGQSIESAWSVWRMDDNGNRFLVRGQMSPRADAERLALELTQRGHKQVYWVEPDAARS